MSESSLGNYLIIALMAMAISMAIIPLMMKFASVLGMVDQPDSRKVHSIPVPRVGGLGIVVGALLPLVIWLPFDNLILSFLVGSFVLLIFGVWDDVSELDHYVKFVGQFLAAGIVVYYGDLYVVHFPFMGSELLPKSIGQPFTVIAIVGMMNAINHSDGLDGLAGGESLLSLVAIIYLAFLYHSAVIVIIAAATMGGVFGFLRFNSHPAQVFMGDGGSQFLGFVLAFLVLMLTQQANEALSPALPLLLLGLPIADILAVFILRARGGMNLFMASRNHIHHRLLDLGFHHYEAVIIIYSIQILFVVSAIMIPYGYDAVILSIYLSVCVLTFLALTFAERKCWKINHLHLYLDSLMSRIPHKKTWVEISNRGLEIGVSLFLIAAALMSNTVPLDISIASFVLLSALFFIALTGLMGAPVLRLFVFVTVGFSVYLLSTNPPECLLVENQIIYIYFGLLMVLVFLAARSMENEQFQITPLDYLVIMIALVIGLIQSNDFGSEDLVWMAIQIIILFYASELVIHNMRKRLNGLTGTAALALALIALRGII